MEKHEFRKSITKTKKFKSDGLENMLNMNRFGYCLNCKKNVSLKKRKVVIFRDTLSRFILFIGTCGLYLPLWILHLFTDDLVEVMACSICGSTYFTASRK